MNISPEEAARALNNIEASRASMRSVIRSHNGHYYLWLWGGIWSAMALLFQESSSEQKGGIACCWLALAGLALSFLIGWTQNKRVRGPIDKRFVGAAIALLVFGYAVWPIVLGLPHRAQVMFAYQCLVWMQIYILSGLWFDNYLFWVGLLVSALVLVGLLCFAAIFWWWAAIVLGGSLIGTGFYVRFFWR
jgi:hypothetical protein